MGSTAFDTPAQQVRLDAVMELLRVETAIDVDAVARLLALTRNAARPYLQYLRECGLAHQSSRQRWWRAGPSASWQPPGMEIDEQRVIRSDATGHQRWPARRDPLVEALFGPPGKPIHRQRA